MPPVVEQKKILQTGEQISNMCVELQKLQRHRAVVMKSRIMQANRLQALVAGTIGYSSGLTEKERMVKFVEASGVIRRVLDGTADNPMADVIRTTMIGIDAFENLQEGYEKQMLGIVKQLPIASWVNKSEQRGFGLRFLSIVIGETGDLANYSEPSKLWRRMGCSPWTFNPTGEPGGEKTLMGSTWRFGKEGKLPASEWELYGYCPRRRSIAYLIGEGIVKQNVIFEKLNGNIEAAHVTEPADSDDDGGVTDLFFEESTEIALATESIDTQNGKSKKSKKAKEEKAATKVASKEAKLVKWCGPYRRRYDEAKTKAQEIHKDEWSDKRCHLHGMLCATKLLLKNLWIVWNNYPPHPIRNWMK